MTESDNPLYLAGVLALLTADFNAYEIITYNLNKQEITSNKKELTTLTQKRDSLNDSYWNLKTVSWELSEKVTELRSTEKVLANYGLDTTQIKPILNKAISSRDSAELVASNFYNANNLKGLRKEVKARNDNLPFFTEQPSAFSYGFGTLGLAFSLFVGYKGLKSGLNSIKNYFSNKKENRN